MDLNLVLLRLGCCCCFCCFPEEPLEAVVVSDVELEEEEGLGRRLEPEEDLAKATRDRNLEVNRERQGLLHEGVLNHNISAHYSCRPKPWKGITFREPSLSLFPFE